MIRIIKIIAIVFFILLLGFNSYLLLDKKLEKKTRFNDNISKQNKINQDLENLLYDNVFFNIESAFGVDLECIDEKGNKHFLSDLTEDKPKLVLWISERMCNLCISSELNSLNKMRTDIHKEDIILLASFSSSRLLKIFKKTHQIPFHIYKVDTFNESSFSILNRPYYFVLEKNLVPKYLFIPDKNIPRLSDKYLSRLKPLFLNENGNVETIKKGIKFMNVSHDFGKVKYGKTYSTRFAFINNMEEPLLIKDITTTCGCTISKYDKSPILPKSKSDIRIDFKAEHLGKFQKQIMVFSNAKNKMVRLLIKGEVVA